MLTNQSLDSERMNIKKTLCLLALGGVAFLPFGAGAYDSSTTGSVTGSVNVGGSANSDTSAGSGSTGSSGSVSGSAGADVSGGVNVGGNGSDDNDTSTSSNNGSNASGTVTGSGSAGGNVNLGSNGSFRVNALGVEVTSAGQVASDADLEVFSDNLTVANKNVAEANAEASGSADLAYYHQGRLFGIFPVKVKAHTWVTAQEDGSVKVNTTMPWWSAFVTGTGKVRSAVDSSLSSSTSISADVRAGADAAARARVLRAIADAHARLDASASANASADSALNANGTGSTGASGSGSGSVGY